MKNFPIALLSWILASALLVSCGGDEPIDHTPAKDTKAPIITVSMNSVNIIAEPSVTISGNALKIGNDAVASWKDDVSKSCKVELSLTPAGGSVKAVNSGDKLSEEGKLQIRATDDAGNSSTADITLTRADTKAPEIDVKISEKNVIAGVKVTVKDNRLLFDDTVAATWTDDFSKAFAVELALTLEGSESKPVDSGVTVLDAGKLVLTVADEFQNKATAEIVLKADAIYGLESLQNLSLQVDKEVNLMTGLTIAEGLTLQKVEVVQDGARTEVENPNAYTPEYPGSIDIILTLARADGSTVEIGSENLSVNPLEYSSVSISDLAPADIVPIIGQVNWGDRNVYSYTEHLRVAEAVRIIEMMWEYGAGAHSRDAYQELLGKLNVGMTFEYPLVYDNYEIIEGVMWGNPSSHAYEEWGILNALVKHANFKILGYDPGREWEESMESYLQNHPNTINIFWNSSYSVSFSYERVHQSIEFNDRIRTLCESKNLILWAAGTNIRRHNWSLKNKIYNKDYEADEHGLYSLSSMANSDKNTFPNCHLLVTIATNKDGDIDQTNETWESSKFPIGFADNVLFSGRGFLIHDYDSWLIIGLSGKYATSETNYLNVALTSICFQLFAEVADVDQLLEMIRSTALTDYIRFDLNGDGDTNDTYDGHPETVPLQLINPAGFIKKYLMPADLPKTIGAGEVISLNKGYYKGVVFDIPGAEVKIGDEWIPVAAENASRIKAANPMDLEWRLNGSRLRKYGFSSGQTIEGKMLLVDDQWNGLRLEVPVSIILK